ncbi:MAG: response regulator [Alphaproteobacteria bacterium]
MQEFSILLVEDDLDEAKFQRHALMRLTGFVFSITHVESLADAVRAVNAAHYDIILLDLTLPDSVEANGVEVMVGQSSGAPVIVLSGVDDPKIEQQVIAFGAQEFVSKGSVKPQVFARLIRSAILRQDLHKKLESKIETLNQIDAQYRHMIATNIDAMVVVDTQGAVQIINPAGEKLFARTAGELLGTSIGIPIDHAPETKMTIINTDIIADVWIVPTLWQGEHSFLATLRFAAAEERLYAS